MTYDRQKACYTLDNVDGPGHVHAMHSMLLFRPQLLTISSKLHVKEHQHLFRFKHRFKTQPWLAEPCVRDYNPSIHIPWGQGKLIPFGNQSQLLARQLQSKRMNIEWADARSNSTFLYEACSSNRCCGAQSYASNTINYPLHVNYELVEQRDYPVGNIELHPCRFIFLRIT